MVTLNAISIHIMAFKAMSLCKHLTSMCKDLPKYYVGLVASFYWTGTGYQSSAYKAQATNNSSVSTPAEPRNISNKLFTNICIFKIYEVLEVYTACMDHRLTLEEWKK